MIKGMGNFNPEIQGKILKIYKMQMAAFGGKIKWHELKVVFIKVAFKKKAPSKGCFFLLQEQADYVNNQSNRNIDFKIFDFNSHVFHSPFR